MLLTGFGGSIKKNTDAVFGRSIVEDPRDCSYDSKTRSRRVRGLSTRGFGVLSLSAGLWLLQSQYGCLLFPRPIVCSVSSRSPIRLACKARNQNGHSPVSFVQVVSPVSLSAVSKPTIISESFVLVRLGPDVQDSVPSQADARY